jgi:Glycosyl transferase family 2
MSLPTVSVILPTYQRRELVQRAVASVLAQTYRDFELIVVDDGSTDGTGEALAPLGDAIRYTWQPNRGPAAARNAGLRLARGSIVAFLDSDDRWLPDHLETVVAMLEGHPEVVLASTCVGYHVGGRQDVRQARVVDALSTMLSTLGLAGYTSGIAVRRKTLVDVGGFDERLAVAEDHHLWLRLAGRGSFCFLRRQTIVRQTTRGSLIERGIRSGAYLKSFELIAEAGRAEAERRATDGGGLAIRARAAGQFASALQALARFDDQGARLALSSACQNLPELSRQPDQVANRIHRLGCADAERLHHFAAAATHWPEPHAHTALFLRAGAIALALRAARPREALRLLADWPLRATPGFLLRNLRLWARLLRRGLQARLYRGRERLG